MTRSRDDARFRHLGWSAALLAGVLVLGGCAATEEAGEEVGETVDEIQASETWQSISENWSEFQAAAAEQWEELTDDDLDDIDGDRESLIEEVSEAYNVSMAEAEAQVDAWAASLD